jgi:dTDP-glucose 4,6-dehydratase
MAETRHTPRKVLVTGGAGFIGSCLVRRLLATDEQIRVVNLDALTYSGSQASLAGVGEQYPNRYRFVHGDIRDEGLLEELFGAEALDTVIHLAAESHVDRSIDGPESFIRTNVVGTFALLEAARKAWTNRDGRFHHVSTDEVFGSLGDDGLFSETTAYDPRSPYSASKAASDHLVRAWGHTYGMNVTISNCSNNFGPWQFPEKLIPLMISNCLAEKPLPVYGDGGNVRDWLYVVDHCEAIDRIVRQGRPGRTYNVGGQCERTNIDLVRTLCGLMDRHRPLSGGRSYEELITFVPDRPGHDRRYAIDATRIRTELGWRPGHDFDEALDATVRWCLAHQAWVEKILATTYDGGRLGLGPREG